MVAALAVGLARLVPVAGGAEHPRVRHLSLNIYIVRQPGGREMGVHRIELRPGFRWPRTEREALAANRLPRKEILALLAAPLGWPADDMPSLSGFRFAELGQAEVCLAAAWWRRDASQMEVVCPTSGGSYWDTSLSEYAPLPLAWTVTDLKGDGSREVISSRVGAGAYASPPIYWYGVYTFPGGLPRDVSSEFPGFYKATFLPQLSAIERFINPPGTAHVPAPVWAPYERLVLRFMRLKYKRRILGQKKAGLKRGLTWVKSPYLDVQGLGVETLGEIPDPRAIAALRKLGTHVKNLGTCVEVANALESDGAMTEAQHTQRIQECDTLKPTQPCLLQTGCVLPKRP